ncbi:hypothetical protein FN846DRAFT_969991 [Sphaerosporella brunnea]|uniref:RRN7-type domain-containing protein n=1 Tax=Sphaerosporella brunnea TaxID=1250544 RepID=A0A5J5EJZ1_9PEZI|nr:hypothetical protein FN846DRAFT_969991 [Sphaerosporella brunnea]
MVEYKRLSRCGIDNCKQVHFYLENGRWFCKNGHMREGELEMAADDEGFGQTGARATRAKVETKKVHKVLRGRKGFELYLQCLQILLQKQVWWLIKEKGFPTELEVIARDLWALRLQVVATRLPENLPASQANSQAASRAQSRALGGEDAGYSSQGSSDYLYTSDSDIASTTYSSRRRRQRRVPKAGDRPKLIELLSFCYLGLLLLRSAVSLGDFHRWVDSQDLAYTRAIRHVPEAMREKLSAEYYMALEPNTRLQRGRLSRTVHEMVALFHANFGLAFPPVNREVLLLRAVHDLGLPLEIYAAAKKLAEGLFMTFEWPPLAVTRRSNHWPEAKLLAIVISAVKLCYGLDGLRRYPVSAAETAATSLEWVAWERFLRGGNEARRGQLHGAVGRGQMLEVDVKEADVFKMSSEDLDWYLDWYEKTWCAEDSGTETKLSQGILNLFPLSNAPPPPPPLPSLEEIEGEEANPLIRRLADLHAHTVSVPAVAEEDEELLRPGEQYLYYSWDEEMPHQLKTLIQAASDFLGIECEEMQKVVHHIDRKLRQQIQEKRRNARKTGMVDGEEVVDG